MKIRLKAIVALYLMLSGCTTVDINGKSAPEYNGVDARAQPILDEYMWLSTQNHIRFRKNVTIGFKDLNRGYVVGTCNYGLTFREIDIDIDYWNRSTFTTRMALLFHELTHCYCGRDHDYGPNKKYPAPRSANAKKASRWKQESGETGGYWNDGCPVSIMYPEVLDDDCMNKHYDQYTKEMFDRCDPY